METTAVADRPKGTNRLSSAGGRWSRPSKAKITVECWTIAICHRPFLSTMAWRAMWNTRTGNGNTSITCITCRIKIFRRKISSNTCSSPSMIVKKSWISVLRILEKRERGFLMLLRVQISSSFSTIRNFWSNSKLLYHSWCHSKEPSFVFKSFQSYARILSDNIN